MENSATAVALRVEEFTLANGMRVILQPDKSMPLVATHITYIAGSRLEPTQLCGLAHVCEHVSSISSRDTTSPNYTELIKSVGGLLNGSTSHEQISFNSLVPRDQVALSLHVEVSRMLHPNAGLTATTLEAQRKVVIQEYALRVGNRPYGRSLEFVQKLLYPPPHPYHWPPGGLPDCLEAIACEDVEKYFRTNFTPNRAVLVLVGNFSPDEVATTIERHFSFIPPSTNGYSQSPHNLAPLDGPKHEVVEDNVSRPRVHLAYRAPGFGQADWYAAALLFRSLAVGRTSPLQQKLVCEERVAHEVKAQMVTMRDASTAAFVATAAPGVKRERLENALVKAIEQLFNDDTSTALASRAQKKALTDHYSMIQQSDKRAAFIASSAIFCHDPSRFVVENEYYGQITPLQMREFGVSCNERNRVVLTFVPRGEA